jgi:hypothetical protein
MGDYLWDRDGEVDAQIERLEQRLAPLRFRADSVFVVSPPERVHPGPGSRHRALVSACMAAAAGALLAWLWIGRSQSAPTPTQPPVSGTPAYVPPTATEPGPPPPIESETPPISGLEPPAESAEATDHEHGSEAPPSRSPPASQPEDDRPRERPRRAGKPRRSRPAAPPKPEPANPDLPEPVSAPSKSDYLDIEQVKATMKSIATEVRACGRQHDAPVETIVRVHVGIEGRSGRVLRATARDDHEGTPLGHCIERLVAPLEFPTFTAETMGVVYPFRL